jgi:hypothetical protein
LVALSYQDNSTGIKVATKALGFAGVLLDVIAAFLALVSSTIFQRHVAITDKQLNSIEDASGDQIKGVVDHLDKYFRASRIHKVFADWFPVPKILPEGSA